MDTKIVAKLLTISTICFGIFILTSEYLYNRSLWFDEAHLALFINAPIREIYQTLGYDQSAPLGFIVLAKLIVGLFGNSEYVLRSIPLVSCFLAIFLLYKLLTKYIAQEFIFLGLFQLVTSIIVVRYATEFKQYSSDMAVALFLLTWGSSFLGQKLIFFRALKLGFVGASILWFSFPAIFSLGGIGLALCAQFWRNKSRNEMRNLLVIFCFWILSFVILYMVSSRQIEQTAQDSVLASYWRPTFMPFPPHTIHEVFWFIQNCLIKEVFVYAVGLRPPAGGIIVCIIGGCSIFKKDKQLFILLCAPFLLALIASGFHRYPIIARSVLFYAPIICFFIAEGMVVLWNRPQFWVRMIQGLLLISILWHPIKNIPRLLAHDIIYIEEIKPVLRYVQEHIQKDDAIYVYCGAIYAFQYYSHSFGLDHYRYKLGIRAQYNWQEYIKDIASLKGFRRIWFVFSHITFDEKRGIGEDEYILSYLDSIGVQHGGRDSYNAFGCLYEFKKIP